MKPSFRSWGMLGLFTGAALLSHLFGQACAPMGPMPSSSSSAMAQKTCYPGPGATGSPKNVEEAVDLINSLPRPVTIGCFLEALDRPLGVYATTSPGRAQPTEDPNNPRLFITSGSLIISVVPQGRVDDRVEFSVLRSPGQSLKAEVHFPITGTLMYETPYSSIRSGDGTSCRFCHKGEYRDSEIGFAEAYISDVVAPIYYREVSLGTLKGVADGCNSSAEPHRCGILKGVFSYGSVYRKALPEPL